MQRHRNQGSRISRATTRSRGSRSMQSRPLDCGTTNCVRRKIELARWISKHDTIGNDRTDRHLRVKLRGVTRLTAAKTECTSGRSKGVYSLVSEFTFSSILHSSIRHEWRNCNWTGVCFPQSEKHARCESVDFRGKHAHDHTNSMYEPTEISRTTA